MKIKFESDLVYQQRAIEAVVDVFKGQEQLQSNFTVLAPGHGTGLDLGADLGYANKSTLHPSHLVKNVQDIQLGNAVRVSVPAEIHPGDLQFSIEMETGTGKTYVFTRSILELNQRYGFTKFVIVVPSVSIREGIYKSLQLTEEHFAAEFDNIPYRYFIYDSSNLSQVRDFATSNQIRIMIINIQAFARSSKTAKIKSEEDIFDKKVGRILLDYNDRLGDIPINLIQKTRPVVIVDEPQSTMSSDLQKASIQKLNPLAIYRFSATHREVVNMLYKYDAIDAYNDNKVKKIEVASLVTQDEVSDGAFVQCISTGDKKGFRAQLMIDIRGKKGKVKRQKKEVRVGDDLYQITRLDAYEGYVVQEIGISPQYVEFTNGTYLEAGDTQGGLDDQELKRYLIRRTVREHLDKELRLNPKGIKVLSLFFIDEVVKYREYDEEGNDQPGLYARMFEEEYSRLVHFPKYRTLFREIADLDRDPSDVHKGYFSIDKKSKASNKKEKFEYFRDTSGSIALDEDTYRLIMIDKEKLLSLDHPVRFIFSHSALKEGWDNPNVFQICLLKEMGGSEIRRRQEIGRGLRIAVNQAGERVYDENVNILTTVVNESFKDFVEGYQKELTEDLGIRFGYLATESFNTVVKELKEDNEPEYLGQEMSQKIFAHFIEKGYIDRSGKVQDSLKMDLKEGNLDFGLELDPKVTRQVEMIIREVAGNLDIKNSDCRDLIQLNKEVFLSEDFKELWDSIKYKTTYRVAFDSEELIRQCIRSLNDQMLSQRTSIRNVTGTIDVNRGGVTVAEDPTTYTEHIEAEVHHLPDIITYLQEETDLTRRTVVRIIKALEPRLITYFKTNPQAFIERCIDIINTQKRLFLVDGIKYDKKGEDSYYDQGLIEERELISYLNQRMVDSAKSPYQKTLCDSNTEMQLAREFEQSDNIKLYTKLPGWFSVPTPLGDYNPDWAILYQKGSGQKLYFITESKGTMDISQLNLSESGKISCGKAHFDALSSRLILAHTLEDVHRQV